MPSHISSTSSNVPMTSAIALSKSSGRTGIWYFQFSSKKWKRTWCVLGLFGFNPCHLQTTRVPITRLLWLKSNQSIWNIRYLQGTNQQTSIFCMLWYKRCCNWLGAMKGMALWSRGFSRGSLFRTWPKPETAHEKSLAPRVPTESNSTSNCRQPPCRKCTFPPFLRLVLDLFLFCTTTCTHSCLKSLYFLPFLNPLNNRCVWPAIVCKPVLFAHNRF